MISKRKYDCKTRRPITSMAFIAALFLLVSMAIYGDQGFVLSSHAVGTAPYYLELANTNGTYTRQLSTETYEDAYSAFNQSASKDTVIRDATGKVLAMKRGMVITRPTSATLTMTPAFPSGYSPYVTKNIVTFYNSTSADGSTVTFPIFGFTGSCSVSEVWLIPGAFVHDPSGDFGGSASTKWKFDYYTKDSDGNLVHYLRRYSDVNQNTDYASITIDKAPDFMTTNVPYYSADALHYYKNPYDAAANSVSADSYAGLHAVYYQLISYRTKTSYTATQLDSYLALLGKTSSVYYGKASDFITYQNKNGVNAAMEMSFANLESGYGTSSYAKTRFNLFGINAGDANPDDASYYTSVADCIEYHTGSLLSRSYFDAYAYINTALPASFYDVSGDTRDGTWYTGGSYQGDAKYFGAYTGNKHAGVNVRYASDPSHGEKIAGLMYAIDSKLGMKDYDRYSIGLTNKATYAYSQPDATSNKLYKIASKSTNHTSDYPVGMAVTILSQIGEYYQIISDMPLKAYTDGTIYACNVWNYDHTASVAYVKKDCITLVRDNLTSEPSGITSQVFKIDNTLKYISKIKAKTTVANFKNGFANGVVRVYSGNVEISSGDMKTGMKIEAYGNEGQLLAIYTTVVTGDVNGDGNVSISDLVQVNRYLLGLQKLSGARLKAGDLNNSATITIADLVKLNRVLLGTDSITPY
jgi:beta-N-acetylglucosaminidase